MRGFFISGADQNRGQQRVCLAYAKIKSLNRGDFGAKKKVRSQREFNPLRKQRRRGSNARSSSDGDDVSFHKRRFSPPSDFFFH
ncbi:hypothetical protein U1Q18_037104 [Sarracenia purpurea var. burkii]